MKNIFCRVTLVTAIMPIVVGGCATHGGVKSEPVLAAANASPVAATTPPSDRAVPHLSKSKHPLPPPSELEARHGIQITQIALTAAGGLVDLRFKILDAAKARKLLGDAANVPSLIVGENPPLVAPHHALRGAKFGEGVIFYILYPNARNVIKTGVEVMVAMGDVRLGPVTVQ